MTLKTLLKQLINVKQIKINHAEFHNENQSVHVHLEATKGQKKRCPICQRKCPGYDSTSKPRMWRHLDFGSVEVKLVSKVSRIECPEHGVHIESVPWAYPTSRFTKEFENYVAYLSVRLNKTEVSQLARISWHTVGPILSRVKTRLEPDSTVRYEDLEAIGIDETSYRKGHQYMTVIMDHKTNQVVAVKDKHGKEVLEEFLLELNETQRESIRLVSGDGARWIKNAVEAHCPNATFCIDGFHVVSWAIEAMDEARKEVWRQVNQAKKEAPKKGRGRPKKGTKKTSLELQVEALKGSKYALGKNPENLTRYQQETFESIKVVYPKLFKAWQLKEALRAVFKSHPQETQEQLKQWLSWASRSRIKPMVELSRKIRRHQESILATVTHQLSNARIEAMNNKIKVLIRKSYGFRNKQNMFDMIMIICSNLVHEIKHPRQLRCLQV